MLLLLLSLVQIIIVISENSIEHWALNVTANQRRVYSQSGQDGALEYIFSKIGTQNNYFVEIGFNVPYCEYPHSNGSNTQYLKELGWRES